MAAKKKQSSVKKTEQKSAAKKETDNASIVTIDMEKFLTPLAIIIAGVIIGTAILVKPESGDEVKGTNTATESSVEAEDTAAPEEYVDPLADITVGQDGTFTEYDTDRCEEGGKPQVFLFSTTWCPHCQWISESFDNWANEQTDVVVYHYEVDTLDNTLVDGLEGEIPEEHMDIYEKFNPGGSIPTYVFGCKYGRVGNGFESQDDLAAEVEEFDSIVGKL